MLCILSLIIVKFMDYVFPMYCLQVRRFITYSNILFSTFSSFSSKVCSAFILSFSFFSILSSIFCFSLNFHSINQCVCVQNLLIYLSEFLILKNINKYNVNNGAGGFQVDSLYKKTLIYCMYSSQ